MNATYNPTAGELAAGFVNLTLTTTGNGTCNAISDIMVITFSNAPTVDAGPDQIKCANNALTTLAGSFSGATGCAWSGGAGTYTPNNTAVNAVYTPTGAEIALGTLTLTLTTTGNGLCSAEADQMIITFTTSPTANAGIDQTVCANNTNINLNGSVTVATGGQWAGGTGSYNPGSTALATIYSPSAPEIAAGQVILTLTTTGNGTCNAISDQILITITPAPIVNAGIDQTICKNNNIATLGGTVTGATGGSWSGGMGLFSPDNTTLGATYTPTVTELSTGFVNLILTSTGNGTCLPVSDNIIISYSDAPIVDAGPNQTVGANNPATTLAGTVSGATGGIWSGGNGTYSPSNTALNAIYTPSALEITAGTVTLTLTSTGNGTCNPVSDIMTITITAAPIVNAGVDQTSCANNPSVTLNGSITGATGGIWSGGNGTYNPGNTALNAVYTPNAAEILAGNVTLTLTSTGNGPNNPVTDQMTINITPAPTANAGTDITICSNNPTVILNGTVTGATGGQWTGGLGFYNPNGNTLNAAYTPTQTEINFGSVTLTLTTTGNGSCIAVTDEMTIFFTPSPTVNAGSDQIVCGNNANVTLDGSITIATGGHWSGGSGTYSPNDNTLNAVYTPTAGEIASGTVNLTLTTTGNGTCVAVSDAMIITISPAPIVNAGSNLNSCVNNPSVTLNGSVLNATGGIWSGGTGSYDPGNTTLNAIYTPSAAEISVGTVILTLTSTGNGSCLAASDQMIIDIGPAPIVNAGTDQTVCANNSNIMLSGSSSTTTGQWTGGLGLFIPDNNTLNAIYTPTMGEIALGTLTLTLTSTNNGACNSISDNMVITFTPAPTVNAGSDQIVCANTPDVILNGSVTGASGGIWTGGSGTYVPDNITMNATYTPSATEIATGSVTLTLTSTGNGNCIPVIDNITIIISVAPIVNAGPDLTSCANNPTVTLNGNYMYAGGAIWSGGTGIYNPDNITLNATYTPSVAEIATGTVTLTLSTTGNGSCNPSTDNINITINPSPVANASVDQTACRNNETVTLNGSVIGASGGAWSGGGGSFLPNNSILNATYTPTAAEVTAGFVNLILTTTGNGTCNAVTDMMTIIYTPKPVVNAGVNQTVCANNPDITLNGTIAVATGGIWSDGLGTYNPNNTTLNAVYTPTAVEIAQGYADLTLTSTGNGTCNSESDQVHFTITPAPTVIAGPDQIICVDDLHVDLNGFVVGITTTGIWSGGISGTFTPSATALNAVYNASSADSTAGSITLVLTSTGNGNCLPVTDTMIVNILPTGTANAGPDQSVCGNNANALMNGSVGGGATIGTWSSSGSGIFIPTNTTLNAVYVPSQVDTSIGSVTLTLTANSCNMIQDQMILTITNAPYVNAGMDITVCVDNLDIPLNGQVSGASTTGVWTGGNGGIFTPDANTLNAVYHANAADSIAGHITLVLTATNIGLCAPKNDTLEINILPPGIVNAGPDQVFCANNTNVVLNGSVTGGGTTGIWSTSGTGTFVPSATDLQATYLPSAADTAYVSPSFGVVTLSLTATNSCNFSFDLMQVTFNQSPWVSAGADQSVCYNNPAVNLNGYVVRATGGQWSGGTGTFSPNITTLNAVYTPSVAEKDSGLVILYLTSTGNGTCNAVTDSMTITITPEPIVNAGLDTSICANNAIITLYGAITVATGGIWSGGTGTYNPDNTALNAIYTPSAAEISTGSVTLTLTSTGNGNCNAVSDQILITITPAPTVYAGTDMIVGANNPDASLNGNVTIASGGIWSDGLGSFNPDNYTLDAVYTPSVGEIASGGLDLVLTSIGNGSCIPVCDTVHIDITAAPVANAGLDQTSCANNPSITLNGSVFGAIGGIWSGGTGTYSPDDTTLNAVYTPSATEITAGTVTLTLTSTGNGPNNPVTDEMTITITPSPIVNAGVDQHVCISSIQTTLQGIISGGSSTGIWTTSGDGTFIPDNFTLNAQYVYGTLDTTNGSVTLTLTSTNNGLCNSVSDNVDIIFGNTAFVSVGNDIATCENDLSVLLNGFVSGGSNTGLWISSGSGQFFPNDSALNATYLCSAQDSSFGNLQLVLSSTNNGGCLAGHDTLILTIERIPSVNAGPNQAVCIGVNYVNLSGTATNVTGVQWTTSGSGTFLNANALNTLYYPSQSDSISGSVVLTLSSTGNVGCNTANDFMIVTFTHPPQVDAGNDITICESNLTVPLAGYVWGGTSTGIWTSSSGTGTFVPSSTVLNASYICSSVDSVFGSVTLKLTSTNNAGCAADDDSITVTIDRVPTADAGPDQLICIGSSSVNLSGSYTNAANGRWTTSGSGTFFPSDSVMNPSYYLSSSDSSAGTIIITLTTEGSVVCNPVSDIMLLHLSYPSLVNAGSDITVCENNMNVSLNGSVTGGSGTGVWTTTSGGIFTPDSAALNATYIPSQADSTLGTASLVLTSTNNGSCGAVNDTVIITIDRVPTANAGPDQLICTSVNSVNLSGSYTNATNGIWTTSGTGTFVPNDTAMNASYYLSSSDSIAGTVTITLTTEGSATCAAASDAMNINLTNPITQSFSFTTPCLNIPVQFTDESVINAGSIIAWQWIFDSTFTDSNQNPAFTFDTTGNHTVSFTITSSLGCSYTQQQNIYVNPLPTPNFTASTQCYLDDVLFTDSSSVVSGSINNWYWNFGDTSYSSLQNPTHLYTSDGIYNVNLTVTSNSGCSANITIPITVYPTPVAGFTYLGTCSDLSMNFTDTSVTNTIPITSWQWDYGDSNTGTGQNPTNLYSVAGTYQVQLIVGISANCTDTITQSVPVTTALSGYSYSYNCTDYQIIFTDTSNSDGATINTWNWDFGDGNTSNIQNSTHLYADTGTYNVELIISTPYCTDTTSKDITISTLFGNFTYLYNCQTYSINFTDISTYSGYAPNNWLWDFGDGNNAITQNPQYQYADTGIYHVQLIAQTSANCIDTIEKDVSIFNVKASFASLNACLYDSVSFTDLTSYTHGQISSWNWDFGDTYTSIQQNPYHLFNANGNYQVSLVIQTQEGCIDSVSNLITIYPVPFASYTINTDFYLTETSISFVDASTGGSSWNWNFGDNLGTSTNQSPTYAYMYPGNYIVSDIVRNEYGCTDTAIQTISIIKNEIYGPVLPTGFTPNNDGENDTLFVRGGPFKELLFRVYNEWGQVIFETEDPDIGWDGTRKGVQQPMGVYVYTVKATTIADKQYSISGEITLIR
ncbi:MAG: PKD domain-containing protein [Bacteroidota bacterium]